MGRGACVTLGRRRGCSPATGLHAGTTFGSAGIEIDHTASASPRGTKILAEVPNLFGPRTHRADDLLHETPRGAKVFAAGAFTLAGSALHPEVDRLLQRLWKHMTAGT